jgi:hypothetical protein
VNDWTIACDQQSSHPRLKNNYNTTTNSRAGAHNSNLRVQYNGDRIGRRVPNTGIMATIRRAIFISANAIIRQVHHSLSAM